MRLVQPRNARVLAALFRSGAGKAELTRHDAVPAAEAYLRSGCHPDVVERLWDQLAATLPQECRYLIQGAPAVVHPCGLVLAVGLGTQYGLRIPASCERAAAAAGAKTITTWSGGGGMDIRQSYGADWIFGAWLVLELDWCRAVYLTGPDEGPPSFDATNSAELEGGQDGDTEGDAAAAAPTRDFAAIAAEEQRARLAALEQRASNGELEAMFQLFHVLFNSALNQRSRALLERAGSLLLSAAAQGHPQAAAMVPVWPRLKAEFKEPSP